MGVGGCIIQATMALHHVPVAYLKMPEPSHLSRVGTVEVRLSCPLEKSSFLLQHSRRSLLSSTTTNAPLDTPSPQHPCFPKLRTFFPSLCSKALVSLFSRNQSKTVVIGTSPGRTHHLERTLHQLTGFAAIRLYDTG